MISHMTLGTNNIERAEYFFKHLNPLLGGEKVHKSERALFLDFGQGNLKLGIIQPFNNEPATHGNGAMVAFNLSNEQGVIAAYTKAIELGATSEGEPGPRPG